ncbi:YbgA family protein [Halobacillus sp. H74]|uniref:YbgA family protein n=1 Tax=Halobacillus sp. H74 TaxID=3457436 RepID=UPI003FCE380A
MKRFAVPKIVVSRFIEFAEVRCNGAGIPEKMVQYMQAYVEFVHSCPESEVETDKVKRLSQTLEKQFPLADGLLLKSCTQENGGQGVNGYRSTEHSELSGGMSGLITEVSVQNKGLAIEEMGRLEEPTSRRHFLTKLFTLASFREVKEIGKMNSLRQFHTTNKYLFMAYHPDTLKRMGRAVANHEHYSLEMVIENYEGLLHELLREPAKPSAHVNVCQHISGYFKQELTKEEKENFRSLLGQYKKGEVPLNAVIRVLSNWASHFQSDYLKGQTYFEPYPQELLDISDSGEGSTYP